MKVTSCIVLGTACELDFGTLCALSCVCDSVEWLDYFPIVAISTDSNGEGVSLKSEEPRFCTATSPASGAGSVAGLGGGG